jgi:hypothetical protein
VGEHQQVVWWSGRASKETIVRDYPGIDREGRGEGRGEGRDKREDENGRGGGEGERSVQLLMCTVYLYPPCCYYYIYVHTLLLLLYICTHLVVITSCTHCCDVLAIFRSSTFLLCWFNGFR